MLKFTVFGAVSAPSTVQIRLSSDFPGRIAAGAPTPSRDLSLDEAMSALSFFIRAGRRVPCDGVVFSGARAWAPERVAGLLHRATELGYLRRVLHLGLCEADRYGSESLKDCTDLVLNIHKMPNISPKSCLFGRTVVLPLSAEMIDQESDFIESIHGLKPRRVIFTWPLPPTAPPPPASHVLRWIRWANTHLKDVPFGIKGLPCCHLEELSDHTWRSTNRWYVDAEHQGEGALLFFPDVMSFIKGDDCRFCSADSRCDGLIEPWLRAGRIGPVRPLEPS